MALRTILFCDFCNPQGIRMIEQRRSIERGDRGGRRITDGRSWYEGPVEDAVAIAGWRITGEGQHICPHCLRKHQEIPGIDAREDSPEGLGAAP